MAEDSAPPPRASKAPLYVPSETPSPPGESSGAHLRSDRPGRWRPSSSQGRRRDAPAPKERGQPWHFRRAAGVAREGAEAHGIVLATSPDMPRLLRRVGDSPDLRKLEIPRLEEFLSSSGQ